MLPLGHMGISVAVVRMLEKKFQSHWVDYRVLLVASLLPDLIDKPIGYLISGHLIFSGRYYGHSLVFLLVLFILALVQWYYQNSLTLLILCIGVFSHDVLDFVSHHEEWAEKTVFSTNILVAFEIIGGCILVYFFSGLVLRKKVMGFIKTGELYSKVSRH